MKKKIRRIILALAVAVFAALLIWSLWENTALECHRYTIAAADIPESFDGFRIAQASDLHNAEFGENNVRLLAMLRDEKPDIIAITGDLIDSRRTDTAVALEFLRQAVEIAPCYYVAGNHEARIDEYYAFREEMNQLGVRVLSDERADIEIGGEVLHLLGVDDPSFTSGEDDLVMAQKLEELRLDSGFSVLLSHRPELLSTYAQYDIGLVLSGHAHGGQVRLPWVGGLLAPNQGLFPEFEGGLYASGETKMIVSRGLGNSLFPLRFNNRPELIIVVLACE